MLPQPIGLWKVMLAGIICFWFLLCSFCFNFWGGWGEGCVCVGGGGWGVLWTSSIHGRTLG